MQRMACFAKLSCSRSGKEVLKGAEKLHQRQGSCQKPLDRESAQRIQLKIAVLTHILEDPPRTKSC